MAILDELKDYFEYEAYGRDHPSTRAATNSIKHTGAPEDFDQVARRFNVEYTYYSGV